MRGAREALFVLSLFLFTNSYGEVSDTNSGGFKLRDAAMFELFVVGFSFMAASEPEITGALCVAISPLAAATNKDGEINYVGSGLFASFGLYNMVELGNGEYSDNEIAKRNFIILNSYVLGALLNDALFTDDNNELGILPKKDGLVMGFNHRF